MTGPAAGMLRARVAHAIVGGVGTIALVWQLILIIAGASVLVPESDPGLAVRLVRFVSYFTIQANLLVVVTSLLLLADPARDGSIWRVVRLDAVTGIVVTGLVHWFFLRPILNLSGASYVVDKLLHVVAPLLALAAWAVVGPRRRIAARTIPAALIWPAAWLTYIVASGALTGWYPYPFLDVGTRGPVAVAVAALLVAALIVVVSVGLLLVDRVLPTGRFVLAAPAVRAPGRR